MSGNIIHGSSKTYDHNTGLSCCFRQWRANSHCNVLHGYALKIRLEFEAGRLDERDWVVDFGGLKDFKNWLEDSFDHKTIVAKDDPYIGWYREGQQLGTIDLIELDGVGCEFFSEHILLNIMSWLDKNGYAPRVRCTKVEVSEHTGNSAWVRTNYP